MKSIIGKRSAFIRHIRVIGVLCGIAYLCGYLPTAISFSDRGRISLTAGMFAISSSRWLRFTAVFILFYLSAALLALIAGFGYARLQKKAAEAVTAEQ